MCQLWPCHVAIIARQALGIILPPAVHQRLPHEIRYSEYALPPSIQWVIDRVSESLYRTIMR